MNMRPRDVKTKDLAEVIVNWLAKQQRNNQYILSEEVLTNDVVMGSYTKREMFVDALAEVLRNAMYQKRKGESFDESPSD